jgi:hypothetical protein
MPILCVPSNTLRCVLAAFLIAGCAGDAGPEGPAGPAGGAGPEGEAGPGSVIRLDDEPAGANCQNGGVAVRAGVDDNGNGTLETGEIDSTEYVCGTPTTACTNLEGDYIVNNSLDLATFKLHGCSRITGNLIVNSPQLTGLPGLESLTQVDGEVRILFNSELTSMQGLANLTRAEGVVFEGNDSLATIAFPKLTQVDGDVVIAGNQSMTTLSLPVLATAEGLTVEGNAALTAISGINALTSVLYIDVFDNGALTSISGFTALDSVADVLAVSLNPSLTTVSGFGALQTVGGRVVFFEDVALTSVSGFGMLQTIGPGGLEFINDPALTTVTGFDVLETVEGPLRFRRVTGFPTPLALSTVPSFNMLTTVGGELFFGSLPALTTLPTFPALTEVGSLTVQTTGITTLSGFAALERTTGTDPGNFNGGWFYIINCDSLTTVTGVGALTETTGDFGVAFNAVLTDLSGVTSLTTVGYDFQVSDNPMFPACEADAMAAGLTSVGNQTITTGNDTNATCS